MSKEQYLDYDKLSGEPAPEISDAELEALISEQIMQESMLENASIWGKPKRKAKNDDQYLVLPRVTFAVNRDM